MYAMMYCIRTMLQVINIAQARQNLSRLIDEIVRTQEPRVLIRESRPQAVVVPYEQYVKTEANWKAEFTGLIKKNQNAFKALLKKQKKTYPKTEQEMYELIDRVSGRH